jgi:AcrR family transcriptional regulator
LELQASPRREALEVPAPESVRADAREVAGRNAKFAKLKPGPGRSAAEVRANQRTRLQRAIVELADERGSEGITVRGLSNLAGVSTRTFYNHFSNTGECLGKTCESTMFRALEQMTAASAMSSDWKDGVRRGVGSLLRFASSQPRSARLVLIDVFAAGPESREWVDAPNRAFEETLFDLVPSLSGRTPAAQRLVSGMVAGVTRILRATTMAGRADELPGLTDELANWLLDVSAIDAFDRSSSVTPRRRHHREGKPFPAHPDTPRPSPILDDRQMILKATLKLASTGGFQSLTVPRIRSAAGVSRRSFNRNFTDAEDCFLRSVEWLATQAASCTPYRSSQDRSAKVSMRQILSALCGQVARSELLASLVFVAVRDAGRDGLLCEERMVSLASARLTDGGPDDVRAATMGSEASAAALWRITANEIAGGRARQLPRLAAGLARVAGAAGETLHRVPEID